MTLVKMVRDVPEVAGGKTTGEFPEDAVKSAMNNGWRKDDSSKSNPPKAEEPVKAENPVKAEESSGKDEKEKSERADSSKPKFSKRDA